MINFFSPEGSLTALCIVALQGIMHYVSCSCSVNYWWCWTCFNFMNTETYYSDVYKRQGFSCVMVDPSLINFMWSNAKIWLECAYRISNSWLTQPFNIVFVKCLQMQHFLVHSSGIPRFSCNILHACSLDMPEMSNVSLSFV